MYILWQRSIILENDVDVGIDKYDLDCTCVECYNSKVLPHNEYEAQRESEWYEIQGGYYG